MKQTCVLKSLLFAISLIQILTLSFPPSLFARVPIQIPSSPDVKSALGVRRFGMETVTNYSAWVSRKVKYTTTYIEWDTKDIPKFINSVDYHIGNRAIASGSSKREPYTVVLSVPMVPHGLPNGESKAGTAPNLNRTTKGEWDKYFRYLGARISQFGLQKPWPDGRPKIIMRLGWEQSAKWYPWSSVGAETEFKACWRHIVDVVEKAAGSSLVWEWNISNGDGEITQIEKAYPGDDVVDLIGIDFYDGGYSKVSTFAATNRSESESDQVWSKIVNGAGPENVKGDAGLQWMSNFARSHNKKIVVTEWGVRVQKLSNTSYSGGGDDVYFIQNVFCWFSHLAQSGQLVCLNYFENAGSSNMHKLSPGKGSALIKVPPGSVNGSLFPKAARRFLDLFGGPIVQSKSTPTVSLVSPADGSHYPPPATITLSANVSGSALQVDFYNGQTWMGADRSAPYSIKMSGLKAGNYAFKARVTDASGNISESGISNVSVAKGSNPPPSVSITSPANHQSFLAPASVTMTANATDSNGSITKVQFYNGSTLLGTDTTRPYSFSWKNVPAGSYSISAKATDNGGAVSVSSAVSIAVNAPPPVVTQPAAPTGLSATGVSSSQINLVWSDNANDESGFKIERRTGTSGTFVQIGTVGANVKGYQDTGLSAHTQYAYRVRANNSAGNSAYSNVASATTTDVPPVAPSGLSVTVVSSSQLDLAWSDLSDNESEFQIERKTGSGGTYAKIGTVGAGVSVYQDTGLSPNTLYDYRVRAINSAGNSAYSNVASAKTKNVLPPAPSGLGATVVNAHQINLAWTDNADNEAGFKIERKTGSSGVYAQIATVGSNVRAYQDTGLSPNTLHDYRVRANNSAGNSAYSNVASVTTTDLPPDAPTGLSVLVVSSSQLNLSWTDVATNETGYLIERKTGSGGTYIQIGNVGTNVNSLNDTGLTANTQYFYRVRAVNSVGSSPYSNEAIATTKIMAPAAPSGLGATVVSSSQINLAWTDNADNETGYKIERKTGGGSYVQIGTVGADVKVYQDTGLSAVTQYTYRVRANNSAGNSAYSNVVNATTLDNPPVAPTGLSVAVVSPSQLDLSWTDMALNETGYLVERKTGAAGTYSQIGILDSNVSQFHDSGLSANTQYVYRVRALNSAGNSSYSNEAGATTLSEAPLNVPPDAPVGLVLKVVSVTQISLSWTDVATNEDRYQIERKKSGDSDFSYIGLVSANTTEYLSAGLSPDTTYTFRVRAHNVYGTSAYSNEVSATTTLPSVMVELVPTELTAVVSGSMVNLAWPDTSTGETSYRLWRKEGVDGAWTYLTTVRRSTTYSDVNVVSGKTYVYRVRARVGENMALSDASVSDWSNEATVTVP